MYVSETWMGLTKNERMYSVHVFDYREYAHPPSPTKPPPPQWNQVNPSLHLALPFSSSLEPDDELDMTAALWRVG